MVVEYQALKMYGEGKVTFHTLITSSLVGVERSAVFSERLFSFWRKIIQYFLHIKDALGMQAACGVGWKLSLRCKDMDETHTGRVGCPRF